MQLDVKSIAKALGIPDGAAWLAAAQSGVRVAADAACQRVAFVAGPRLLVCTSQVRAGAAAAVVRFPGTR